MTPDRDRVAEIRARQELYLTTSEVRFLLKTIDELRKDRERYRWRPISEIHEDFGEVVMINIHEPGNMELGSSLDHEFCETDWTHFSQIAPLTNDDAKRLIDAMKEEGDA